MASSRPGFGLGSTPDTPAHRHADGVDFVPTRPFYLLGQHFSAIAAAGPIAGPIIACQEEGTDGSITLPAAMVDILRTYTPGRFVRQQLTHTFVELTADGEPKPPGERKRIDVLTIYCYNTGWAAAP